MTTFTTAVAIGEREELSDIISMIDPDETPIYSNAEKRTTKAIFTEWQVQELAAASASNAVNEGADASYATPTPTVRHGNYHQISQKSVTVSGTLEAVDKAGRDSEVAYQKILKGKELRRDIEKTLVAPQKRSSSDPRKAAVLKSWITNVDDNGATNATGDGTDFNGETTSGTARALALSYIETVMQAAYEDGGQPDGMYVSPTNKKVFSDLAASDSGVVANQLNMTTPKPGALVGTTSVFLTDFGQLEVIIDRQMGNDPIFLLDSDYFAIGTLTGRNFMTKEMARTGDSEKFQLLTEWTTIVDAPKAHAAVYALSGS